jgi:hypothetical protein
LEALLIAFEKANVAQMLRTLICHRPRLRKIHFLVSSQSKAIATDLKQALLTRKSELGLEKLDTVMVQKELDFENIEGVYFLVDEIVEQSLRKGFSESDIIVDLTGGKKPASIALALYTLHRNIRCQYVQTDGEKRFCNMAWLSSQSLRNRG